MLWWQMSSGGFCLVCHSLLKYVFKPVIGFWQPLS